MPLKEIRWLAHRNFDSIILQADSPIELLKKMRWNIPKTGPGETISQVQIAEWNLELDEQSCLGRLAKAAILIENSFPACPIMAGEVLQDRLRDMMIEMIDREKDPPRSMLEDVLLYEEPHAVIMLDKVQFDPISQLLGTDIIHPKVQLHPIWEHIACSWLVSKASLENDPSEKLDFLLQAETICPGTTLVMESMISPLVNLDRMDEAIDIMSQVVGRRPTARALFVIGELTRDVQYHRRLRQKYPPAIFELLLEEVAHAGARQESL